jgi:hypothetical protein
MQLDIYMVREAKHDINKFNKCINKKMSTLASRDEISSDIISNLFTGYTACSDKDLLKT